MFAFSKVGANEGAPVGENDGKSDGEADATLVGMAVTVGTPEGDAVGFGDSVGATLGSDVELGRKLGRTESVGAWLGILVVGEDDGKFVGCWLGSGDFEGEAVTVGCIVGMAEGEGEGSPVDVGPDDGTIDGIDDGYLDDGPFDGASDGEGDGAPDGRSDGESDGESEGANVGTVELSSWADAEGGEDMTISTASATTCNEIYMGEWLRRGHLISDPREVDGMAEGALFAASHEWSTNGFNSAFSVLSTPRRYISWWATSVLSSLLQPPLLNTFDLSFIVFIVSMISSEIISTRTLS
jgi:hypothetical protein